jgi:hypothetical protein
MQATYRVNVTIEHQIDLVLVEQVLEELLNGLRVAGGNQRVDGNAIFWESSGRWVDWSVALLLKGTKLWAPQEKKGKRQKQKSKKRGDHHDNPRSLSTIFWEISLLQVRFKPRKFITKIVSIAIRCSLEWRFGAVWIAQLRTAPLLFFFFFSRKWVSRAYLQTRKCTLE